MNCGRHMPQYEAAASWAHGGSQAHSVQAEQALRILQLLSGKCTSAASMLAINNASGERSQGPRVSKRPDMTCNGILAKHSAGQTVALTKWPTSSKRLTTLGCTCSLREAEAVGLLADVLDIEAVAAHERRCARKNKDAELVHTCRGCGRGRMLQVLQLSHFDLRRSRASRHTRIQSSVSSAPASPT